MIQNFYPSPLDIISIIKLFPNIKIWSYKHYAKKSKLPLVDVTGACQSESGCTFYDNDKETYLIVFNSYHIEGRQNGHSLMNLDIAI